ncbi:hypothetical protein D7D52_23245 [Nocardia yunnanensis]|uniref:Uncharacterized protein n=1 Tax=Nocardia yunnanensis TaxID=2382165 RepID=A0A386ZFI7_9NOCA|nr:hypothetical protein [Nocardia yunnanensis]AYF76260.1 hypothetical protein D7D52_23245 [Nocardia yunnanensis]
MDRGPGWPDDALLRGERDVVSDDLMIGDTEPLQVNGPGPIFTIDGQRVDGRDLVGRDLSSADWQIEQILVATDGTREDALRIIAAVEQDGDYATDTAPQHNPVGVGEVVTVWSDEHGQWDLAMVRHAAAN